MLKVHTTCYFTVAAQSRDDLGGYNTSNARPFFMLSPRWLQRKHQTRQNNRSVDSVCSHLRRPLPFFALRDFTEPCCDAAVWSADGARRSSAIKIHLTPDRCGGWLLFLLLRDNSWRIKEKCLKEKSWHIHWREKRWRAAVFSMRHGHAHGGGLGGRSVNRKSTRGKWDWRRRIRLIGYPWKIALLWAKLRASPLSARSKQLLFTCYPDG